MPTSLGQACGVVLAVALIAVACTTEDSPRVTESTPLESHDAGRDATSPRIDSGLSKPCSQIGVEDECDPRYCFAWEAQWQLGDGGVAAGFVTCGSSPGGCGNAVTCAVKSDDPQGRVYRFPSTCLPYGYERPDGGCSAWTTGADPSASDADAGP